MTIEEIYNFTENIKLEINNSTWQKNDVRLNFYKLYYTTIYDFYIGNVYHQLAEYINEGKVFFSPEILHFENHLNLLREIPTNAILKNSFSGNLNRNVFIGTWSSFELSVSQIFENITTDSDLENIIKDMNKKLLNSINDNEENDSDLILELLKKSSFIPINRKFEFIVKKNKAKYTKDLKNDYCFLELVTNLRNCLLHSNGLYHGRKNLRFEFAATTFTFEKGKPFKQIGNNPNLYFDIANKIKEVFTSISITTAEIEFIIDRN
jgi:hypothetical protein